MVRFWEVVFGNLRLLTRRIEKLGRIFIDRGLSGQTVKVYRVLPEVFVRLYRLNSFFQSKC